MTTEASIRLLRAGLVGSLIFVLGTGGHLAGGGAVPRSEVMAALCVVTLIPVVMLSSYRFSVPVLVGLLGVGQGWLHWSFSALGSGQQPTSTPLLHVSAHAGHLSAADHDTPMGIVISSSDAAGGWLMLAAHAIVTVVTALFLTRGEDALRLVATWLEPLVRLPDFVALPPRVCTEWPAGAVSFPAAATLRLPTRRGPPPSARPPDYPPSSEHRKPGPAAADNRRHAPRPAWVS